MIWPKSETSDFGWGEGVPPCRDLTLCSPTSPLPKSNSDGLFEQALHGVRVGIPGGAANLLLALERDHGALRSHIELAQQILLGIEIDVEAHHVFEPGCA